MSDFDAVDLFAGPGGWDEGAKRVGLKTVGLEWDHAACQTAVAAGHPRIRCDVAAYPALAFAAIRGLIASPPCTLFSSAGTGLAKLVIDVLAKGVERLFAGEDASAVITLTRLDIYPVALAEAEKKNAKRAPEKRWSQERVEEKARTDAFTAALILEPARYIMAMNPEWIGLEQVPEALPIWQVYARALRRKGYSVWTCILNAADYGVPQKRKRACLGASRVAEVGVSEPTHSEHGDDGDLFGTSRLKHVTMAQALGWGFDEPSCTVSSGGAETGGAEPFANANYRRKLATFVAAGKTGQGRPADAYEEPADTITGKGTAYWLEDPTHWAHHRPATTVVGSFRPDIISAPGYRTSTSRQNAEGSVRVTVVEAGVLQSFPRDYPWRGNEGKQYQQVGNAVPPLLAAHILAALTGTQIKEVAA